MEKEKRVLKCVNNNGVERWLTLDRFYPVEYTYLDDKGNIMSYYMLDDSGAFNYYSRDYFHESTPRSISTTDPIVEQVKELFDKRSQAGIKKYGTTLYENNKDNFFDHLQQELMDGILYLQKLMNDMIIKSECKVYSKQELSTNEYKFTDVIKDQMTKSPFNTIQPEETAVKYILDSIENGNVDTKFDWTLAKEKAKELFEHQVIYAFYSGKYSSEDYKNGDEFFNKNFKQ